RWPIRLYILAVLGAALAALPAGAAFRGDLTTSDTLLLALVTAMAAVGQLWPVHLSVKVKMTVDETATFAAGLLLGPFYAMVVTAASTLIALHFRGVRQRWYNRGFNTAAAVLATGAAATVYVLLAGPGSIVVREPWAIRWPSCSLPSATAHACASKPRRRSSSSPISSTCEIRTRMVTHSAWRTSPGGSRSASGSITRRSSSSVTPRGSTTSARSART